MTLDQQTLFDACNHCRQQFQVIRGSVYDDNGNGIALYLAAMHGCESIAVDLVIAIRDGYAGASETSAIFIKVHPHANEIQMSVVDPTDSCWRTESYLGRLLIRDEALASPLIDSVFHIADHIVMDVPGLRTYLAA